MTYTSGCDISRWQDDNATAKGIDFAKLSQNGIKFVYIRATIGGLLDEDFLTNWAGAKAAGILRGAYHAFRYDTDALTQARLFMGRVTGDTGELPPALDLERLGFGSLQSSTVLTMAKTIVDYWDLHGKKTVIYTNPDAIINFFGNNLPTWFLLHDLWIANYGVMTPSIGRQYKSWRFWQQTDRGDGLAMGVESKQLDLDVYNGSLNELRAYCGLPAIVESGIEARLAKLEQWATTKGYII